METEQGKEKKTDWYISQLLPEEELRGIIEEFDCGIELIDFSIAEKLDRFENTLEETKALLVRLGNPPVSIHGPFLDLNPVAFDSRVQQVTRERFEQAYLAAQLLGARNVVYHSGMVPTVYYLEGWAERAIDFWSAFLDGKSGIQVVMENVLDREYAPFLEVAEAVLHPDFGMCLDLGHAHCYSKHPVTAWSEALAGKIRHLHLHDNDQSYDAHWGLGRGTIPLRDVLPNLFTDNPGCSACIECAAADDIRRSFLEASRLAVPDFLPGTGSADE